MIGLAEVDPQSVAARHCLDAYYAELATLFENGFEVARSRDPLAADLRRPRGAFLVATDKDRALGCIGLKGDGSPLAEIKRMWVDPAMRGSGLARKLIDAAEAIAVELGITTLRLDTNRALPAAVAMYRAWGWQQITPFNDDPYADYFFEKHL